MDWLASGLPGEGQEADRPRAGEVARRGVPTCPPDARIGELYQRVQHSGWDVCVVVNERCVVLGLLCDEAWAAGPMVTADQAMKLGPQTFRPNVSLDDITARLRKQDVDSALITTSDGVLLGLLCRQDVEGRGNGAQPAASSETSQVQGR
jgi:CBS domain-containing protein